MDLEADQGRVNCSVNGEFTESSQNGEHLIPFLTDSIAFLDCVRGAKA
jgi:hypothetical protein